ncbi:hypothetical protein TFUB22_00693 [Tannerella forsythia]|nr:hypothetical protein TFUB22_00693 [Tannerella forsythia]
MYQADLTKTERKYMTKVLNQQERKRKYELRLILECNFLTKK